MNRLLLVSADGHAVVPEDQWPYYLEKRFHEYLPRLSGENRCFTKAMLPLNEYDYIYEGVLPGSHYDVFDTEGLYRSGQWAGALKASAKRTRSTAEAIQPPCESIASIYQPP